MLLVIFTVACNKKDIPKNPDDQKGECTKKGTIVPMDCVGHYLGIVDADNNYYYIEEDLTNDFSKYKAGDEICFDFELSDISTADYSNQGITFTPATSVDLTCISKCAMDCKPVQLINAIDRDTMPSTLLDIVEMRQEGNSLYVKVAFSGCDADIDPELLVFYHKLDGPNIGFDCVIEEPGVELCLAHFEKEICFDLSELETKHQNYKLYISTNQGSEIIEIVH